MNTKLFFLLILILSCQKSTSQVDALLESAFHLATELDYSKLDFSKEQKELNLNNDIKDLKIK